MPLATELTSCLLNYSDLRELDEMQEWVGSIKARIGSLECYGNGTAGFRLNIEQLFDFAAFDEELCRMRQQLCPVGRQYGQTSWDRAESIRTWLGGMEENLVHVLWERQQQAVLDPIRAFVKHLCESDTVVTFNYDTLVESALSGRGVNWNHGFDYEDGRGVRILKMHGSVDWILMERRPEKELQKFIKLFSKKDANAQNGHPLPKADSSEFEYRYELWRAKDTTTCNAVLQMDKGGLSNFKYWLGLAGLGRYKPLHRLVGSACVWGNAFQALMQADQIYIVGFSLSPYDTMSRFHFASVMCERKKPLEKVLIIDPDAETLVQSFRPVFGDAIDPRAEKAEQVDWREVLT